MFHLNDMLVFTGCWHCSSRLWSFPGIA